MEAKKKFFRFFNFLDAMQLMCLTVHLFFTIKSITTLAVGELTSEQRILQILLMATKGEDILCQLNMN